MTNQNGCINTIDGKDYVLVNFSGAVRVPVGESDHGVAAIERALNNVKIEDVLTWFIESHTGDGFSAERLYRNKK